MWKRQAAGALILAAVTVMTWSVAVAPELRHYRSTRAVRSTRESLLAACRSKVALASTLESQGGQLPGRIEEIRRRFFREGEAAVLIESLAARARERGLELAGVQVGTAKSLDELDGFAVGDGSEELTAALDRAPSFGARFRALTVAFDLVGSPAEILGLLDEIESHQRLVRVERVDIHRFGDGPLRASMDLNMILLDFEGEGNEGQNGRRPGLHADADDGGDHPPQSD